MLLAILLQLASQGGLDPQGDWPCWRGPRGDGVSLERGWSSEGRREDVWRKSVGLGHSCASVRAGKLYTTGFDVEREVDVVWCLEAETGAELWSRRYPAKIRSAGHEGGTLTTPALDGAHLFVSDREGRVRCLDASTGEQVWLVDLAAELEVEPLDYGFGGSPLVIDEKVIVNARKTVALGKATGEVLWATPDLEAMYSTPAACELGDRACAAVFSKQGLYVLDRGSGESLYHYPWRKGGVTVNASTPVVVGERIFISSGYGHGCALVAFEDGEARAEFESKTMRTKLSGCVLYEDHLYGFDETRLKCIGLDGAEKWRKRNLGMGAVMAADGRLIVVSESGDLIIAKASPEGYEELSRASVFDGGTCWSTPVLANGLIYCRSSQGELVCRDHRAE